MSRIEGRKPYRYQVVDVFTQTALEGNALAVFPSAEGLDDRTMQKIARELNLSETVFIQPSANDTCVARFRIFTPAKEMPFAGHPTIGASYVLVKNGLVPVETSSFSVQEGVGPVAVTVETGPQPMIWLETPPIRFGQKFEMDACAAAIGLKRDDLMGIEPQLLDAGNPTLLIAVKGREIVDRASVHAASFEKLEPNRPGAICVFVFAPTDHGAYSRMFAPEYGIVEDPATGSSTGPLGAFMKHHGLLARDGNGRFHSEQGTKMGRRSLLYFKFSAGSGGERVMVGGHVTPLVEAVMNL